MILKTQYGIQLHLNKCDVKVHLCDKINDEVGLGQAKVYEEIEFTPSAVAKVSFLQSENYTCLKLQ